MCENQTNGELVAVFGAGDVGTIKLEGKDFGNSEKSAFFLGEVNVITTVSDRSMAV